MNDLISSSFSSERGFETTHHVIEMNPLPTANLTKFFKEVELVKEDLNQLTQLLAALQKSHQQTKTAHTAKAVRDLRATMDAGVAASLAKAKAIKSHLDALDRDNTASRSTPGAGPGSSSDRTRTSVVNGLRNQLKDSMNSFNDLRQMISLEHRETVERRYYTVTGETPDEKTLDRLISTGESEMILQRAIQEQGRGSILDTIDEIQERHSAVKNLEKSLRDLHQVFLDMAVLVDAQGEMLDDIESNVQRASSFVNDGTSKLQTARKLQKNTRKWMCYAIIVLLIIILIIVLAVIKPWN